MGDAHMLLHGLGGPQNFASRRFYMGQCMARGRTSDDNITFSLKNEGWNMENLRDIWEHAY